MSATELIITLLPECAHCLVATSFQAYSSCQVSNRQVIDQTLEVWFNQCGGGSMQPQLVAVIEL